MLAADQPFVQLAKQPEGLFAHLGKRRRRKGDWTADQDRQLILQFWRHLIDPAKWPAKDITVDEGFRHGEAVKMRLNNPPARPVLRVPPANEGAAVPGDLPRPLRRDPGPGAPRGLSHSRGRERGSRARGERETET